jgi:2-(1,2-epoxy-1,2-dihydrophenyl)acetyl-CoA isomerase
MTKIDTGTDHLLAEVDDGVAKLTLNRPERRNALSEAMLVGLSRVLGEIEADEAIRCVVLTGAGSAFCSGGDIKDMADRNARTGPRRPIDAGIHRQRLIQRATSGRLWNIPKPTLAAMPGAAAGAGFSLALACDLRYAAKGAIMTTAFARVGFSGDFGGTWFLTRLVGSAKAKELYFFADRITAEEAEEIGIVNAVFEPEDLEREVMDRARKLAAGPSVAFRYMKENLNRAVNGELVDCLDVEATHHIHAGFTDDHREAALAFMEKREPKFEGR